ncbi:unnamed protein product [Cuscuta epithymum]|uniref:Carboxypeptidase n=2 Tax=Cuscuta epithymum TaxID=186058 RepID=A0AAV0ED13_9ASTE|nr:unnamed protein product [Cuscuta epithymum]
MAKKECCKKIHVFFLLVIISAFLEIGFGLNQEQSLFSFPNVLKRPSDQQVDISAEGWGDIESSFSDDEKGTAAAYEDHLIVDGLPGQPPSPEKIKQYGGYVNVDIRNGRSLYYYFVESAQNSEKKPLILWLNGGPGCSSIGAGAFVELGPFGVNPDGKTLYSRKFSWNKVANVLFLDSPAGVGFSYSNTSSDYDESGDKMTAQDSYNFLVNWFKIYPHYQNRDFYIMGEHYAGYLIPEIADIILYMNKMPKSTLKINLKGIMIGNGVINYATDLRGFFDYVWSHALISDESYKGLLEHCSTKNDSKCEEFLNESATETGYIDVYNIYGPLCLDSKPSSTKFNKHRFGADPCESKYVNTYLNLPDVQKAMHANITKLPYTWTVCSDVVNSKWTDRPSTMFPIYKRLIASGLQIYLYSGDVDANVPVTSTRYSLDAMNLNVITRWHAWRGNDSQEIAGYKVVYEGITFVTVKGAGQQVPQLKPRNALTLLNMFIANKK